jgi:hypothetical protein
MLLEVNTVLPNYQRNFNNVIAAQSQVRQVAQRWLPFLAAKERPVDLTYDFLHRFKEHGGQPSGALIWRDEATLPPLPVDQVVPVSMDKAVIDFFAQARATITRLKNRGVRLAFVLYPADREPPIDDRHAPALLNARTLAREFSIPVFDLRNCGGQELLTFTDYVHLSKAGAQMICRVLETEVGPRIK